MPQNLIYKDKFTPFLKLARGERAGLCRKMRAEPIAETRTAELLEVMPLAQPPGRPKQNLQPFRQCSLSS